MRGDAPGAVTQQVLAVLEVHPGRAQAASQCVLEIVHAHLQQVRLFPGPPPCGIEHVGDWLAAVGEDVRGMLAASCLHHGARDSVEHRETIIRVLHVLARDDDRREVRG